MTKRKFYVSMSDAVAQRLITQLRQSDDLDLQAIAGQIEYRQRTMKSSKRAGIQRQQNGSWVSASSLWIAYRKTDTRWSIKPVTNSGTKDYLLRRQILRENGLYQETFKLLREAVTAMEAMDSLYYQIADPSEGS